MRKLLFSISVVLALLVSAVFSVQTVMALTPPTGTVSWSCISGGARLSWSGATPGERWHLHLPSSGGYVVFDSASGFIDYLQGDGRYNIHDLDFGGSRPAATIILPGGCTSPSSAAPVSDAPVLYSPSNPPPSPFWLTDPHGNNRIDPSVGEKFAVYCYPGGNVDIWGTKSSTTGMPFHFGWTTYPVLSSIPAGGSTQLTDISGGAFTASKDTTGTYITFTSGGDSKTFSFSSCGNWANYVEGPRANYPLRTNPSYTTATSSAITSQLNAAKARLASASSPTAIAQAQADVARWESLYRANATVITEHADGSTSFLFIDGTMIIVAKDGTVK